MKTLNIKLEIKSSNEFKIPAELFLFIGKKLKSNNVSNLNIIIDGEYSNSIINAIRNFMEYYKITNISFDSCNFYDEILDFKNNIFFYPDLDLQNNNIQKLIPSYIAYYEEYWGKIPHYSKKNALNEKYLFINDIILQFGDDFSTH